MYYAIGKGRQMYLLLQFMCCGFSTSDEWLDTQFFNATEMYPGSCNCSVELQQTDNTTVSKTWFLPSLSHSAPPPLPSPCLSRMESSSELICCESRTMSLAAEWLQRIFLASSLSLSASRASLSAITFSLSASSCHQVHTTLIKYYT